MIAVFFMVMKVAAMAFPAPWFIALGELCSYSSRPACYKSPDCTRWVSKLQFQVWDFFGEPILMPLESFESFIYS